MSPILDPDRLPFPAIPEALKTQFSVSDLSLRPFGEEADDRNVDFNQPLRPYLEVQILECCTRDRHGKKPDTQFFWNLDISKRIEGLLTIATIPDWDEFMVPLRCLNPDCREAIEVDFSMAELRGLQSSPASNSPSESWTELVVGQQAIHVRKPTGWDQLKWLKQSFPNERTATQFMLQTLVLEADRANLSTTAINQGEWIPAFNRLLEEIDPLVNFQIQVSCPYCDARNTHPIDWGAFALQRLRQTQQQLLDMVHRLASHYHWNESEIFAIPAWRRNAYLVRIDREAHR